MSFFSTIQLYPSLQLHCAATNESDGEGVEMWKPESLHFATENDDDATASTAFSDEDMTDLSEEYSNSQSKEDFNAWLATEDGSSVSDFDFRILGTSAEEATARHHVLSPCMMEALQNFMPYRNSGDNFWLKYSMVRDGASMQTLLNKARGSQYSILALETTTGEVFGCFTNQAWKKDSSYFGGSEAFLWRMRHSRKTKCHSVQNRAHLETEIDVFPYTGENQCIQLCDSQKIAVGGGFPGEHQQEESGDEAPSMRRMTSEGGEVRDFDWGHGLSLDNDLTQGTSSPCVTFGSPSLSRAHSDGSLFEIVNIELWAMTPMFSEEEALKLEHGKLMLEQRQLSNEDLNKLYS